MRINATRSWLIVALLTTAGLCVSGAGRADDSELDRAKASVDKAKVIIQALQPEQQQPGEPGNVFFRKSGASISYGGRPGSSVTSAIRKAADGENSLGSTSR